MKVFYIMLSLLFLAGCANVAEVTSVARENIINANDAKLGLALEYLCSGASVGSVRRAYKGDFVKWARACPHLVPSMPTFEAPSS